MNFSAPNFIPSYVAAKYAKSQNGIYITGDNVLDVGYAENNLMLVGFCEWDYYYDALIDENLAIPFFQYDLPIVRSVVDKMNISELSFFKNTLYQTSFRPKLYGHYKNEKIRNLINRITHHIVLKPLIQQIVILRTHIILIFMCTYVHLIIIHRKLTCKLLNDV